MKKKLLAAIFLGLVLFLAACGGDDTEQTAGDNAEDNASEATQIEMSAYNFGFDEEEYTVNAGEAVTITLTNDEGMHGIGIDGLDVSIEGDGETTFTPDEPGEYTIYCNIPCGEGHDDMVATLIVQ
ncbi:cupredoxin domain-containing protein [Virgibacillus kimchii]